MTPTVEISRKLNLVEPSQSRMGRLGRLARDRSPPLWPAKLAVPDRLRTSRAAASTLHLTPGFGLPVGGQRRWGIEFF
jgi:hypothetical protein